MLLRWRCCYVACSVVVYFQATASKSLCGRDDEKNVMFISSMVLQWVMTFSSCQQNNQTCMKPQFQWFRCCTNVKFIRADKRQFIIFLRGQTSSLSAPTLQLLLIEQFERRAYNTVKHSVKSTFSISIQIKCNWLPGNPQPLPYIYIYIQIHMKCYICIAWTKLIKSKIELVTNYISWCQFKRKCLI